MAKHFCFWRPFTAVSFSTESHSMAASYTSTFHLPSFSSFYGNTRGGQGEKHQGQEGLVVGGGRLEIRIPAVGHHPHPAGGTEERASPPAGRAPATPEKQLLAVEQTKKCPKSVHPCKISPHHSKAQKCPKSVHPTWRPRRSSSSPASPRTKGGPPNSPD